MRLLVRLRHDADIRELPELAGMGEPLLRPRLAKDLESLEEALAALAVGNIEPLVVTGQAATTDTELESALAEMIDRRDVFGESQGMAQGQHLDGDADLHLPRGHRER